MTAALQPQLSPTLRLQLLLLATVGCKSAWSQHFNFTLVPASCDSGLLLNVDDIVIMGVIDMQGLGQGDTLYSLQVESTFENQSFVHVCSTQFNSSNCVNNTNYGCYCTEAIDSGQMLHVVIRQPATNQMKSTHYRLRINLTNSDNETWIFVPIPTIYVTINDTTYYLPRKDTCALRSDLSRYTDIMFCTRNLNMPVLAVVFGENDVTYYVNLECDLYNITERMNSSGATLTFHYTDSCNRSNAFMCYVTEKTVSNVVFPETRDNTVPIVIGSLLSLFFFVTVVVYLCNGIQVASPVRLSRRSKSCEHSLAETQSTLGSKRPERVPRQKESLDKESSPASEADTQDSPDSVSTV